MDTNEHTRRELVDEVRRARRLPPPKLAKAIRLEAMLTQEQVAQVLGVDRVTVARWELGVRTPRGAHRLAYADLLHDLREALEEQPDESVGTEAREA